jgi:hypothetical protein
MIFAWAGTSRVKSRPIITALLKDPDGYRVEAYCHGDPKAHPALSV